MLSKFLDIFYYIILNLNYYFFGKLLLYNCLEALYGTQIKIRVL